MGRGWHKIFPLGRKAIFLILRQYLHNQRDSTALLQWNPSKAATTGTKGFVHYKGVSELRGHTSHTHSSGR